MHILLMGGTVFLGRHIVGAALARGHRVTLFNRGQQNPQLFPELEKLHGDRDTAEGLSVLQGRRFDAVIDPSAFRPEQVSGLAAVLGPALRHYTFISTISAYGDCPPGQPLDESTPVAVGDDGYGALKARTEEAAEAAWPGRVAQVRAGLIVGPHDVSDRFTYWVRRLAQGGTVLAPGRPQRLVQWIDVRDLAQWCVDLAERSVAGVFNAVGPSEPSSMAYLLARCQAVARSQADLVWVDDDTLLAQGVEQWTELPLWIADKDPEMGGLMHCGNSRAQAAGLTFRPLDDTIAATLEWDRTETEPRVAPHKRAATMTAGREAELLRMFGKQGI